MPTSSPTTRFNLEQLALVRRVQERSEGLVARHFRIPALPSSLYPYEVATLADMNDLERAAGALAHLVIYQRQRTAPPDRRAPEAEGPARPGAVEHLYRVCLQDDVILRRLQRLRQASLVALLTYVLTHELIHVVRFQRDEQSYLARSALRQQEEELVHRTTVDLLERANLPGVESLDQLSGEGVTLISAP